MSFWDARILARLDIFFPDNIRYQFLKKGHLPLGCLTSILRFASMSSTEAYDLRQFGALDRWAAFSSHRHCSILPISSASAPFVPLETRYLDSCSLLSICRFFIPKALAQPASFICPDRSFAYQQEFSMHHAGMQRLLVGYPMYPFSPEDFNVSSSPIPIAPPNPGAWVFYATTRPHMFLSLPKFQDLVSESAKMRVLDSMLARLKGEGHRVLIYSQFSTMLDLLEDYLLAKRHKFVRLDGTSRLDERRDVVDAFQNDPSIFCFLLSTRAGGLGITLTAADTVIFYDSDWNPTQDQQAMDRAHRLGQTKPVTVYRLITRGTVEEKILLRARQKHTIQSLVIQDGDSGEPSPFVEDTDIFQPSEMVDLLVDDGDVGQRERLIATQKKRNRRVLPLSAGSKRRTTRPASDDPV
jgi:chromatin-remodeling ATPase INO80